MVAASSPLGKPLPAEGKPVPVEPTVALAARLKRFYTRFPFGSVRTTVLSDADEPHRLRAELRYDSRDESPAATAHYEATLPTMTLSDAENAAYGRVLSALGFSPGVDGPDVPRETPRPRTASDDLGDALLDPGLRFTVDETLPQATPLQCQASFRNGARCEIVLHSQMICGRRTAPETLLAGARERGLRGCLCYGHLTQWWRSQPAPTDTPAPLPS